MIKTYCDHCKKELKIEECFIAIEINYTFCPSHGVIHPFNLCPDCLKEFKELVQNFIQAESEG